MTSIRRVEYSKGMAKMSKAQRTAILDFHNGVTAKGHTLIADSRTIAALIRNGWATFGPGTSVAWALRAKRRAAYVTRAGLIAAGVDMDALHARALADWTVRDDDPRDDAVRAEAASFNMRGGRGDARLWAVGIVRERAHAAALIEHDCTLNPISHAARECPGSVLNRAHAEALQEDQERTAEAKANARAVDGMARALAAKAIQLRGAEGNVFPPATLGGTRSDCEQPPSAAAA